VEAGDHSDNKKNTFGQALTEWYNSETFSKMQEAHQRSIEQSVGWYHMLSPQDKYKCVEALCHIINKSEKEGTSHRGLMNDLGIYPEGFWIDGLMEIHNAMWTEYQSQESENFK
jgi:hypothetical protein